MRGLGVAETAGALLLIAALCCAAAGCGSGASEPPAQPARQAAGRAPAPPDRAPDGRPAIVALGDSLTAGMGVDSSSSYPARLQAKLDAAGYRYRVVNAGVSGDTSAQGLNRLAVVRALKPRIVIVALGANDGLRGIPVASTRQNLDEIITTLKQDGADVVLAGIELPPNYGPQYTGAFRRMYAELARQHRVPFLPFLLEGVGGHAELNQEDGVHPTARGYEIVAENVWRVLKPMLRRPA